MSSKNVTASSFSTFVSVLREEQRNGYSLQKFDYKNGYFCGGLSSDNLIPGSYHEALAAIDDDSKDTVLQKIMTLLPQQPSSNVLNMLKVAAEKGKEMEPAGILAGRSLKQEQKDGDSAASVGENESSPNGQAIAKVEAVIEKQAVKQRVSRRTKK